RAALVEHVTADDPVTRAQLAGMTAQLRLTSPDDFTAARRALATLDRRVEGQAQMLAYRDAFAFLGIVVIGSLPLVLLLRTAAPGASVSSEVHWLRGWCGRSRASRAAKMRLSTELRQ